jgi:hypothetical protein
MGRRDASAALYSGDSFFSFLSPSSLPVPCFNIWLLSRFYVLDSRKACSILNY